MQTPRHLPVTPVLTGLLLLLGSCTTAATEPSLPTSTTDTPETQATTTVTQQASTTSGTTGSTTATPSTATEPARVTIAPEALVIESFPVPAGSRPHDVAPATDGGIWYTAQNLGELGWLDPATGETRHIDLGTGSRPHGVIVAADGTAWVTDGGLNAVVSVEPGSLQVTVYPLPAERPDANLNTAAFDRDGVIWFTGQNGIYGSLDPATGTMTLFDAPRGQGPYGITSTPDGSVYLASLAGSYVGAVQPDGSLDVLEPPTPNQGARRVWSDSAGAIWVSEWNSGNLSRYTPATGDWVTWPLPGDASTYAVYVDELDIVWTSDFGGNAIVRFDPDSEQFTRIDLPHSPGNVRQLLGRPGEVWGAESAADHLVLIRTEE